MKTRFQSISIALSLIVLILFGAIMLGLTPTQPELLTQPESNLAVFRATPSPLPTVTPTPNTQNPSNIYTDTVLKDFIRSKASSISIDIQVSEIVITRSDFSFKVVATLDNLGNFVDQLKAADALSEVSITDIAPSEEANKLEATVVGRY